jgi:hypothetical protein
MAMDRAALLVIGGGITGLSSAITWALHRDLGQLDCANDSYFWVSNGKVGTPYGNTPDSQDGGCGNEYPLWKAVAKAEGGPAGIPPVLAGRVLHRIGKSAVAEDFRDDYNVL